MVGRTTHLAHIEQIISEKRSAFIALTGRRRIGKTYFVEQSLGKLLCFRVTGIQDGDTTSQLTTFTQKLSEYSAIPIATIPNNWQEAFFLLKSYLKTLPTNRKQVLFFDELPWMSTHKSNFIQLFAHLWNDYLSKEQHFILVICGSATSWIYKNIQNDKGGFHNRITHHFHLKPFTLKEAKELLLSKKINLTNNAIAELYMVLGGVPFYLDKVAKAESPIATIERLCFAANAPLSYEYDNLYKALFDSPTNHEAIVKALSNSNQGLIREEVIKAANVQDGGPFNRAMDDLVTCGFVTIERPFGKKKRGSTYRLIDEYSNFYHRFIAGKKITGEGSWMKYAQTQAYKIWTGYAFENLCKRHIKQITSALGIAGVYTQVSSFRYVADDAYPGFQIDIVIDRDDKTINICECKYYAQPLKIDKNYAKELMERKSLFMSATKTNKNVFTTLITNLPIIQNEYSLDAVDVLIVVDELFG